MKQYLLSEIKKFQNGLSDYYEFFENSDISADCFLLFTRSQYNEDFITTKKIWQDQEMYCYLIAGINQDQIDQWDTKGEIFTNILWYQPDEDRLIENISYLLNRVNLPISL